MTETPIHEAITKLVEARAAEIEAGVAGEEHAESERVDTTPVLSRIPKPPRVFPPEVQRLLDEAESAFSVPTSIPVAVFLALLSCVVGRSRAISPKKGWIEHGNVWIVLVAASGTGKSPVSQAFFRPVAEHEEQKTYEWKKAYEFYSLEMEEFKRSKKEELGFPPKPPKRTQYYLDDATVEALGDALADNPRGIMWRVDELSGLLASFDRYYSGGKEGGTRARLLSSFDCQEWKSSRRDVTRNTYIPAACVSIFGGLQPAMIKRSFDGSDSDVGFLPRFIFIRAEREKPALWSETSLSAGSEILLRRIVDGLIAFELVTLENGKQMPAVVPLSNEAKTVFVDWYDRQARDSWAGLLEGKEEAWGQKLKSHALRLCLLLHCLDAVIQGKDGLSPVSAVTMEKALQLAEWVKENQIQTIALLSENGEDRTPSPLELAIMQAVIEEVERCGGDSLTIPNARLAELVNGKLPVKVTPEQIGKAASSLGLGHCRVGGKGNQTWGRTISPEKLEEFRTTLSTLTTLTTPLNTKALCVDRHEKTA